MIKMDQLVSIVRETPRSSEEEARSSADIPLSEDVQVLYDPDQYDITPEKREALIRNMQWLREKYPDIPIRNIGHWEDKS